MSVRADWRIVISIILPGSDGRAPGHSPLLRSYRTAISPAGPNGEHVEKLRPYEDSRLRVPLGTAT